MNICLSLISWGNAVAALTCKTKQFFFTYLLQKSRQNEYCTSENNWVIILNGYYWWCESVCCLLMPVIHTYMSVFHWVNEFFQRNAWHNNNKFRNFNNQLKQDTGLFTSFYQMMLCDIHISKPCYTFIMKIWNRNAFNNSLYLLSHGDISCSGSSDNPLYRLSQWSAKSWRIPPPMHVNCDLVDWMQNCYPI